MGMGFSSIRTETSIRGILLKGKNLEKGVLPIRMAIDIMAIFWRIGKLGRGNIFGPTGPGTLANFRMTSSRELGIIWGRLECGMWGSSKMINSAARASCPGGWDQVCRSKPEWRQAWVRRVLHCQWKHVHWGFSEGESQWRWGIHLERWDAVQRVLAQ